MLDIFQARCFAKEGSYLMRKPRILSVKLGGATIRAPLPRVPPFLAAVRLGIKHCNVRCT
jgi:hypothetical protein